MTIICDSASTHLSDGQVGRVVEQVLVVLGDVVLLFLFDVILVR